MSEAIPRICENPECEVGEKGTCVEGLALDKCPHFGKPLKIVDEETNAEGHSVPLSSGLKLTIEEASQQLRAREARVIAMVGPSEAGKTSLIASLYDLFQMHPVAGASFRRSLTLYELEHTCHDARAASQRDEPHFNRTPRGEVQFYHFDLLGGPARDGIALLLADRGGEEYQDAMDDVSTVEQFVEVSRADTIAVLVDGARLLDSGARHNLKAEVCQIMAALSEGGALKHRPQLALILTKIDLLSVSEFVDRVESDFQELKAALRDEFGHLFGPFKTFRVAASSKSEAVPRGTGIEEVFGFWLAEKAEPPTNIPSQPSPHRMFSRFGQQLEEQ